MKWSKLSDIANRERALPTLAFAPFRGIPSGVFVLGSELPKLFEENSIERFARLVAQFFDAVAQNPQIVRVRRGVPVVADAQVLFVDNWR